MRWSEIAAPLQTEIIYNMSANRRLDWSKITSRLRLTREEEDEIIKHIQRRISQDDAEETYLRQRQQAQREFLLDRANSAASASRDNQLELPPTLEDGHVPGSDYHICRKKEVLLARKFLKNLKLDPMLAGDWGITGDEDEAGVDNASTSPEVAQEDIGFNTKPTLFMRSRQEGSSDHSSTLRLLNSFKRQTKYGRKKSHKDRRSDIPLVPLLSSLYDHNRRKHIRKLMLLRKARRPQKVCRTPSDMSISQDIRLKVDDTGAANIESSPPAPMPLSFSTPASSKDDATTPALSFKELFALPQLPSSQRSTETVSSKTKSYQVRGKDVCMQPEDKLPKPKEKTPTKTPTKPKKEKMASQSKKDDCTVILTESPSKVGKKRKKKFEEAQKAVSPEEPVLQTPVIEIFSSAPRKISIVETPLPQQPPTDDNAKRPAKMKRHKRRSGSSVTDTLVQARSTETPTDFKEDVFDNIPGKPTSASALSHPHHRSQSTTSHVPIDKPKPRAKRSETVAVAATTSRPYSLRSCDQSSETSVINKVEVVRVKETTAPATATATAVEDIASSTPRVTRRTTRRSGA